MAYKKMNPKYKKQWIKALKSGEYKQTQGLLRSTDKSRHHSYCCLGVAKRVCLDTPNKDIIGGYLSDDDRKTLGLNISVCDKLIDMNDGDPPKSFKEIAVWIDKHL